MKPVYSFAIKPYSCRNQSRIKEMIVRTLTISEEKDIIIIILCSSEPLQFNVMKY
jgi:hypothetical protein